VDWGGPKELCGTLGLDPHRKGHFWGGRRRDFPARRRSPLSVALTPGFPALGLAGHRSSQVSH